MKLPNNITEQEFLDAVDKIGRSIAHKFVFGPHEVEDIKQQIVIFCMQGIEKYDSSKGSSLETFLWTHTHNRLCNFKRDNSHRLDKPCFTCPFYDPNKLNSHNECTEYEDKHSCSLYDRWWKRDSAKKNILNTIDINNVRDENESNMKDWSSVENAVEARVLIEKIDQFIPAKYRNLWIKLKTGIRLNKGQREKLLPVIEDILYAKEEG